MIINKIYEMLKLHLIIPIHKLRCNSVESIRISIVLVRENVENKMYE